MHVNKISYYFKRKYSWSEREAFIFKIWPYIEKHVRATPEAKVYHLVIFITPDGGHSFSYVELGPENVHEYLARCLELLEEKGRGYFESQFTRKFKFSGFRFESLTSM